MPAFKPFLHASLFCLASAALHAQPGEFLQRLPADVLDVRPPSERVTGTPGNMRITDRSCRALPLEDVRRRIVNTAVQEWAWFGFNVDDLHGQTLATQDGRRGTTESVRRFPPLDASEVARVAETVGGYWAATPDSDWILQRQNANWNSEGGGARWRDAWSAAFISWVMCESGISETAQFRRAIAHHTYIDQAIRAADGRDAKAVFTAHDPGAASIEPGDLLCRGSRPAYRSLSERRAQLGAGARTHCDIVVKVDPQAMKILVIGGNVRSSVRMKVMHAVQDEGESLRPLSDNGRALFAHLKLQAPAIALNALDTTPTMQARQCEAAQPLLASVTQPGPDLC